MIHVKGFFQIDFLLERNEEQDLRGTYLPEVVLNEDVVYWFHQSKKENNINQLIETETNQLYLLFFPTVPPGFLRLKKKTKKTNKKKQNNEVYSLVKKEFL